MLPPAFSNTNAHYLQPATSNMSVTEHFTGTKPRYVHFLTCKYMFHKLHVESSYARFPEESGSKICTGSETGLQNVGGHRRPVAF